MADDGMIDLAREQKGAAYPLYDATPICAPTSPYNCEFTFYEEELERMSLDASCKQGDKIKLEIEACVLTSHSEAGHSYVRLCIQKCKVLEHEETPEKAE